MRKREKHNRYRSPEYHAWRNMKARCLNPSYHCYHRYGERGIRVCDRWINSFVAFLEDMGPRPGPEYSLERKDNNGNYAPDNCVWIPKGQQARNRHNTWHVTIGDRTMTVVEWADEAPEGITGQHIRMRLKIGWTPERAVFTPRRWVVVGRKRKQREVVKL